MRSVTGLALIAAATVAAASAQNCNPSYNVAGSGDCFTNCNIQAGSKYVSGWTMDHNSENFLPSLKLMCTKGTSEYLAFMTQAGMCMAQCPDDPNLFNNEFAGACAWYAEHKNDQCASSVTTTTEAAAQTTVTNAAPTTTTAAGTNPTTTAAGTTTTADGAVVTNAGDVTNTAVSPVATAISASAAVSGASNSSAIASASSAVVSPATSPATGNTNKTSTTSADTSAADKLHLSAYAIALVAGVSYLTL